MYIDTTISGISPQHWSMQYDKYLYLRLLLNKNRGITFFEDTHVWYRVQCFSASISWINPYKPQSNPEYLVDIQTIKYKNCSKCPRRFICGDTKKTIDEIKGDKKC